ncbi:MAG TPA: hypothetical protein VL443_26580 [Cyclobacteriaceae bacterium]|nr:hypothetical protein [Cyclobacteriaceae bacterium]
MFFTLTKSWSNKSLAIIVFLLISLSGINAQVLQTDRYEITLAETELGYEVAPADNRGVFVYRRLASIESDVLEVNFLDTAFQVKWHGFLPIDRNYVITSRRYFNKSLYFVLHYKDFSKNDIQIINLSDSANFLKYSFKNFIPFNPTEFHVTKKAALIGGYFSRTPVILYFDFATQKAKIVPGLFNEPGELTQIKTYDDDSFDVLTSSKNLSGKKTIWIRSYDENNEIIKSVMLEPDGNKNLIFGRSIKTDNHMQIVAGVYSTNSTEYSKGVFVASIDPSGLQQVRYYNYGDLENFFKYLTVRHEQRIKNRIERRRIKGRKIRFNYRLLVHDLIPYHDQYILLGEAFYPRYNYNNATFFSPSYNSYGRMPVQNGAIFDGYYYTHAVVLGFNENGKLKWDNSFEINDVRTFTLEQFVKLDTDTNKIGLLYLFDNEIRSKVIKDNNVLEGKASDPIKLKFENETLKGSETSTNKLEHWYDHNFMAYGTQSVTSIQRGTNPKRRVFFINKIRYKH